MFNFITNLLNDHKKRNIHIINLKGTITDVKHSKSFTEENCAVDKLLAYLRELYNNQECHGIILRINSPGGSAGSSEEIAQMIKRIRLDRKIPVVSSINDICASGAYLIASQSDYIFANSMSLIGSIGVIMQIPNVKKLGEKIGITANTIKSGEMKDIGNIFRDMTDEEKEYLTNLTDKTHKQFINLVQEKRSIPQELTDGRILDADSALKNNFIDQFGGINDAINYCAKLFNIDNQHINIVEYKQEQSLIKKFLNLMSFI